jgi:hypothetical protein
VIIFDFVSISLSQYYDLITGFACLFLIEVFLKIILLMFDFWRYYYNISIIFLYKWTLFFKIKNIHFKILFLMCSALRNVFLGCGFAKSVSFVFLFLLYFIDFNKKKFNKHNRVNMLFCVIEYLNLYLSLIFFNFLRYFFCLLR